MSDEARFSRHYELWKQESASVGRWAFGTLLFAAVVLLRVIEPYVVTSYALTQDQDALASHSAAQADEKAKLQKTERLASGVKELYEDISRSPWLASVEELKRDLERLGEAYRMLVIQSPAELAETLAVGPEPAAGVDVSQFEPVPERRRGDSRRRRSRPSAPLALRPLTPHTAADLLSVEAESIGLMTPVEFSALLEQRLKAVAEERADATINEIAKLVEDKVVEPLDRLVGDSKQTKLAQELVPIVRKLEDGMAEWTRALLADPEWYRTAVRKDSVVGGLEKELDEYKRDFSRVSTAELERLNESIGERKRVLHDVKAAIQSLKKTTKHLAGVLDSALPGWIRGLVSPEQMIQLYPPTLVFLAILLVYKATTARRHFVNVRNHLYPDGAHQRDAALSSTWTLVYRGATGTLVTALVFVGCAVLLLWLFDRGTDAALTWLANHPGAGWPHTGPWLERFRPIGWTLFIGAACAAALSLVLDGRAPFVTRART